MIKLIGRKRAVLLGAALSVNLVIAAACLLVIDPMQSEEETNLQSANGRISQLAQDTQNIKRELQEYPKNYADYQALEKSGFFSNQDRFEAGRVLDAMRAQSGLLSYSYSIEPIKTMYNKDSNVLKYDLIDSRIRIERISSVLDGGIFALMRNIADIFPQHARIDGFEMRRVKDVDEAALKSMGTSPVPLTEGQVVFDWLTVVPRDDGTDAGQPGGFRGR